MTSPVEADLSEGVFELLQAAVHLAAENQIRTVAALRASLLARFPGRAEDIDAALVYWANSLRERYPKGIGLA